MLLIPKLYYPSPSQNKSHHKPFYYVNRVYPYFLDCFFFLFFLDCLLLDKYFFFIYIKTRNYHKIEKYLFDKIKKK